MASEHLICTIKHQSSRLQLGLGFFQIPIKRTQALEFVARHIYGYNSWNSVAGNSEDKVIDTTYTNLNRQVAKLCSTVPALFYGFEDLLFEGGSPRIMESNNFRKAAIAIAAIFRPEEPHIFMWEELLVERYISDEMINAYPPSMRPESPYQACEMFKMQFSFKDWENQHWTYGDYPWDRWQKKMNAKCTVAQDLLRLARDSYRECYQHSWDDELKLFCGYFDDGEQLTKLVEEWPREMTGVISYLMEHDGRHF